MASNQSNILEELYYGNLNPSEKHFRRDSEYAAYTKTRRSTEEKLLKSLNQEDKALLIQLIDVQGELNVIDTLECFIQGFQLGARFLLDTFFSDNPGACRGLEEL